MATIKEDIMVLRSGRQVPVSCSNLIIRPNLELVTGWQSDFLIKNKKKIKDEPNCEVTNPYNLSKDDLFEMADYMMQLWMKLKDNIRTYRLESDKISEPGT